MARESARKPKIQTITWCPGYCHRGVSAESAHAVISTLPEKTPAALLAAARPKRSPIHNAFTWDDSIAAGRYRLGEAQRMLLSIRVQYVTDTPTDKVPAFVRITHQREHVGSPPGSSTYEATDIALQNKEMHDRVIQDAYASLLSWKRKYEALNCLSAHLGKIDAILQDLEARLEPTSRCDSAQRIAVAMA